MFTLTRSLSPICLTLCCGGLLSVPGLAQDPATDPPAEAGTDADEAPPAVSIEEDPLDRPWRLDEWLDTPAWLEVSGHARVRWEALAGQFRASPQLDRNNHYATSQVGLRADIDLNSLDLPLGATVELLDARNYGAGFGSVLNDEIVNPLDVLQAYGEFNLGRYGEGDSRIRIGRETLDLGSRRLVARNEFRNTINAFDGVHWMWRGDGGTTFDAFANLPVQREPRNFERSQLNDNEMQFDKMDWDVKFWGLHLSTPVGSDDMHAQAYLYGLHEDQRMSLQRELYTPGLRFFRERAVAELDFEVESAIQVGESRRVISTTPTAGLDHVAWFTHASVGYTFDLPWEPNLRVAWDYASGDKDPTDGQNERFDPLFGATRFEYGPNGIYGAVQRSNLQSPELRISVRPTDEIDAFFAWRGVWLAENRDVWVPAGVTDPTGQSGSHVGQQFESRIRWHLLPDNVTVEIGGAVLLAGGFQDNAIGGQGRDTFYGYTQVTMKF